MLLENRLITNSRTDQVSKDPRDTSNNDILYNNIALGLSGIFTYALFKKGALKDIAKPLFELAHKTAGEGINQAGTVMDTVKQWTKLKHLTSAQLEISNQKFSAATNSIFRDRDTSLLYDIFSDFNEGIKTGNYDFYNINKLVRGTVNDLNVLTDMIKDAELQLPNAKLDYSNTYLYNRLSNFKEFTKTAERFMPKEQALYRNKFMQEFVSTMTLTQEQMEQELLESGYRKITLGDILELDDNRVLQLKEGSSLALDHPLKNRFTSLLEEINSVFGDGYNRYNGTSILAGDWKNIIIDPGLRMDIDGNIIDYRMTKDTMTKFLRSLANDFKIPLVQFNPAKVFGLDKIGRKTPLGGFITSEQYMPSITGVGGQEKTVGKWIAEQFGDNIENRNIAIINGTAYTVREVQGQVPQLVELGKGFKLHDITYAHESYGLKPLVNAERQIAGMDLGSPEKITWEEYKATLDFEPSKKQELMYKMGYKLDIGWQEFRPKGDDEGFTLGTFDTSSSIDELTNKAIYWITSQKPFKTNGFEFDNIEDMMNFYRNPDNGGFNYKTIFGQGFESYPDEKGRKQIPKVYMAAKEGFKLKDIINAEDIATKKQNTWAYVRQYYG